MHFSIVEIKANTGYSAVIAKFIQKIRSDVYCGINVISPLDMAMKGTIVK